MIYELLRNQGVKDNFRVVHFGFFTEENVEKAKEELQKEYPNDEVYYRPIEIDVLHLYKKDIDFNK